MPPVDPVTLIASTIIVVAFVVMHQRGLQEARTARDAAIAQRNDAIEEGKRTFQAGHTAGYALGYNDGVNQTNTKRDNELKVCREKALAQGREQGWDAAWAAMEQEQQAAPITIKLSRTA